MAQIDALGRRLKSQTNSSAVITSSECPPMSFLVVALLVNRVYQDKHDGLYDFYRLHAVEFKIQAVSCIILITFCKQLVPLPSFQNGHILFATAVSINFWPTNVAFPQYFQMSLCKDSLGFEFCSLYIFLTDLHLRAFGKLAQAFSNFGRMVLW